MLVTINSQQFWTKGPIQPYSPKLLSDAIRVQGTQRRLDNPKLNRYFHQGFPLGLGWQRMDRETGRGVGGLRWST